MQVRRVELPEWVVQKQAEFIGHAEEDAYSWFSRLSEPELNQDEVYLESAKIATGAKADQTGKILPEYVNLDFAVNHGHFVVYRRSLEHIGNDGARVTIDADSNQREIILPAQTQYQNATGKARLLIKNAAIDAIESAVNGPSLDRDLSLELITDKLADHSVPFTSDLSEVPPGFRRVTFYPILDLGAITALTCNLPGDLAGQFDENAMVFFDTQNLHLFKAAGAIAA